MWVYQSVSVSGVDKIKKRVGLHKIGGLKPKNCPPTMFFFMYIFFKEFGMVLFQRQSQICQKMSRIFSHFHPFWGVFQLFGKLGKASNFQSIFYSMKIKQREKQIVIVIFCLVILIVIFLEIVIFYFQSQKGTRKRKKVISFLVFFFFFWEGGIFKSAWEI